MSNNNIYNILGKLKGITDTAALTPDTQPTTVYESVEARGSITEAVKALEAKYKTFKESKADDIADKKAEKESGDWWGDKKADSKKSREVKGDKYGGSKQKSDDEDDFKSKKTAILDKDEEEVLDESLNEYSQDEYDGAMSDFKKKGGQVKQLPAGNAKNPISTASRHIAGKGEAGKGKTAGRGANVTASKPVVDIYEEDTDKELDEGVVDKVKGAVKGIKRGNEAHNKGWGKFGQTVGAAFRGDDEAARKAGRDANRYRNIGLGAKGKTAGGFPKSTKVDEVAPPGQVAEGLAFGDTVKNSTAKLSKAPKAKLVKESASVRNHPIYTNPDAWNHYKKELDEEELGKATQELDEISKLAGLPKPAVNTVPPIAPAADNFPPAPPELPPLVIEADNAVSINGQDVNVDSIEVDGVNLQDMPDFSDAHITYAEFTDGTPLSERELEQLDNEHGDLVNIAAHDSLHGMADRFEIDETEMEEGNEFSGALAAAKASGIKDFEVAGKKYTVKEDINVNVTASGEEDALNLIRKLSGMPMIAVAQSEEIPDSSAMEVEIDEEFANSPREHIAPVSAAIPSGNDLHGAKRAYKITQPGDNPMAVAESKKDTSWNKYTGMLKGLLK